MKFSAQSGAIAPLLVIILLIAGIFVGTKLVDIPQLLKSRADFTQTAPKTYYCGGISGDSCPAGYSCLLEGKYPDAPGVCQPAPSAPPEEVFASCDEAGNLDLKWQKVDNARNYTVRLNRFPDAWAPDYTGSDINRLTKTDMNEFHGDRAFEAGDVTSIEGINAGFGYFVGGTITPGLSDGTIDRSKIQLIPAFSCTSQVNKLCPQVVTRACAPGSLVHCQEFPTPCHVPKDWTEITAAIPPGTTTRCAQVITKACKDDDPLVCQNFPTPCDVPAGWAKQ